jgi:hypothetical protein
MSLVAARHDCARAEEESTMVVLGLLLLVGAGVFAAAVITSNTGAVGADLWGLHISNLSLGAVFVAGLVTGFAALLGLVVLFAGMRRTRRLRHERKALARENARLSQHVSTGPHPEPGPQPELGPQPEVGDRPAGQGTVGSPPPPSYDRSAIEAEMDRNRAADRFDDGDYAAARTDTAAPVDAPSTRPRP